MNNNDTRSQFIYFTGSRQSSLYFIFKIQLYGGINHEENHGFFSNVLNRYICGLICVLASNPYINGNNIGFELFTYITKMKAHDDFEGIVTSVIYKHNASENYQRTITIYGIGYSGRIYQFNSIKIKVSPNIPIQPPQSNSLTSNQSKVVAEAKKYIGYSTLPGGTNGYYKCQAWVYQIVYRALGIKAVDVSRGTAKEAYQAWCVSSSKSNIPAGATVYFNITSSYHVGIYVGDGMVVHMWSENGQGIVKMQSLDSISNYLGWGWQAGYQLN